MKRRSFVRAVAAVPAVPAVLAQRPGGPAPQGAPAAQEAAPLEMTGADAAATPVARFLNAPQLAALRRVSDLLMPAMDGAPGAVDAGAPEFLDFLIAQSPAERQQLYRTGLDTLNSQAKKRFNKAFAELDAQQADALLAPLKQPWSPEPPADPLARFLSDAKRDVRTATLNSPQYAAHSDGGGRRRFGGGGLYWYPLD